jgi:hypothetical protein
MDLVELHLVENATFQTHFPGVPGLKHLVENATFQTHFPGVPGLKHLVENATFQTHFPGVPGLKHLVENDHKFPAIFKDLGQMTGAS